MEDGAGSAGMFATMNSRTQYILDKISPHYGFRWTAFVFVFIQYLLRVYLVNGWYIVTYGLGIYLLNQLIGFISPQVSTLLAILASEYLIHVHSLTQMMVEMETSDCPLQILRNSGEDNLHRLRYVA